MEQEELNLVEILKNCPKGTKLYSTIHGEVIFNGISTNDTECPIRFYANSDWDRDTEESVSPSGHYFLRYNGECILFPARDQRDWSKFVIPKPDLPEGTIVMCGELMGIEDWCMRKYSHNGKVYNRYGRVGTCGWRYIIPFDKFDPSNIGECIKNYNYGIIN